MVRLCWPRNKIINQNLTFSGILGRFRGCGVGAVKSAVSLLSVNQVICKVCPNSGTLAEWLAWKTKHNFRKIVDDILTL